MLLDRHMPGISGEEVLDRLDDRSFAGRVIMVTAIDPGFDVLDMPFDDYLCKPVDREDIREAVDQQCRILGYETLGAYFSTEAKRSVIEAEVPEPELDDYAEYQAITDLANALEERTKRLLDDPETLFESFDDIAREGR